MKNAFCAKKIAICKAINAIVLMDTPIIVIKQNALKLLMKL